MGLIYLINETGTDNYKIGVTRSKTVNHRKHTLQTGNASVLEVVKIFETKYPYRLETMLHMQHFDKREHGEWFILEPQDVFDFIPLCEKLQKRIDFLLETNPFFPKDIK